MRKTTLLFGVGIGFILGSRAGRGPYEQLEGVVRKVTARPDVQDKFGQLVGTAKEQAAAVAKKVGPPKPPSEDGGVVPPSPAPQSYADPQDLQFSTAAARKEEMVDELMGEGVSATEMPEKEDEFRQSGDLLEPRAGNKPDAV
jgi:hypothetical protein